MEARLARLDLKRIRIARSDLATRRGCWPPLPPDGNGADRGQQTGALSVAVGGAGLPLDEAT